MNPRPIRVRPSQYESLVINWLNMGNLLRGFLQQATSGAFLLGCLIHLESTATALPDLYGKPTFGYQDASFTILKLPVLPSDPRTLDPDKEIYFDLLISPTGDLTAKAAAYAPNRDLLPPIHHSLDQCQFAPALECDEPVFGLIRHTVGDYFFPTKPDPDGEVIPAQPLWALDRDLIQQIDTVCHRYGDGRETLIDFRIGKEGEIIRLSSDSRAGRALIKYFFQPLKSRLAFEPATLSGEPIKSNLTLRLSSVDHGLYLNEEKSSKSEFSPLPRNPNSESSGEDHQVVATIEFNRNGEVAAARVDGNTPPELATAVIAAVRSWTYLSEESTGDPAHTEITCRFGFIAGMAEALLLDEPEEVIWIVPRPKKTVTPDFPAYLKAAGLSGQAETLFIVDAQGHVRDVQAWNTTHSAFSAAAQEALLQWEFEPGTRNGEPIAFRMMLPIEFNLNNHSPDDTYFPDAQKVIPASSSLRRIWNPAVAPGSRPGSS